MKAAIVTRRMCGLLVAITASPPAFAEPSASMSHLPFLWAVAIGFAALFSWLLIRLIGRSRYLKTPVKKWGVVIVLFAVLLVFILPVIVALGSILITGRTM